MSLWSACHVAIGPPSATQFCPSDVKMWTISIINSQYKKINFTYSENYFDIEVINHWKEHEEMNRVSLWSARHGAVGPRSATPFCPSDVKMWTISVINIQYKKINLTYSENYFDIEWYNRWKEHEETNRMSLMISLSRCGWTPISHSFLSQWRQNVNDFNIYSQYKKFNLTYSKNYFDIEWYTVGKSMKRQTEWVYDRLVTLRLDPH